MEILDLEVPTIVPTPDAAIWNTRTLVMSKVTADEISTFATGSRLYKAVTANQG